MPETNREALIDLLVSQTECSVDKNGDTRCRLAKPDLIMMSENIRRHGVWCASYRAAANTIRSAQMTLFEDENVKITFNG